MGLPEDTCVYLVDIAARVHDIGKIAVPAEILAKPGRLNRAELALVKTHSQVGYDILSRAELPYPVAQTVLQHHERLDGSGYPQGLGADDILPEASILAVADVVEAMSSHRPYRPALGLDVALGEIRDGAGTRYDHDVVDACTAVFAIGGFKFPD
jgi:HD-GYP domain-containing protein (c-di-GMP phosphodiesterase class II)